MIMFMDENAVLDPDHQQGLNLTGFTLWSYRGYVPT
jgi:hypothetical protein